MEVNPLDRYPHAFFATHLRQLTDRITEASKVIFDEYGIATDPRTVSILIYLSGTRAATTADIALALGHSHQLASQRIAKLIDQGLVQSYVDRRDSRRRPHRLTRKGAGEVKKLVPLIERFEQVFSALFAEIETDLSVAARRALQAIEQRPLQLRYAADDVPNS